MNGFNINVNLEALRQKNNRLKNIATELETNVGTVMTHVNNVSTGWTGTNSDEYVRVFTEFKPKMEAKVNAIKATGSAIDKTIAKIAELQAQIKSGIGKLG